MLEVSVREAQDVAVLESTKLVDFRVETEVCELWKERVMEGRVWKEGH